MNHLSQLDLDDRTVSGQAWDSVRASLSLTYSLSEADHYIFFLPGVFQHVQAASGLPQEEKWELAALLQAAKVRGGEAMRQNEGKMPTFTNYVKAYCTDKSRQGENMGRPKKIPRVDSDTD